MNISCVLLVSCYSFVLQAITVRWRGKRLFYEARTGSFLHFYRCLPSRDDWWSVSLDVLRGVMLAEYLWRGF